MSLSSPAKVLTMVLGARICIAWDGWWAAVRRATSRMAHSAAAGAVLDSEGPADSKAKRPCSSYLPSPPWVPTTPQVARVGVTEMAMYAVIVRSGRVTGGAQSGRGGARRAAVAGETYAMGACGSRTSCWTVCPISVHIWDSTHLSRHLLRGLFSVNVRPAAFMRCSSSMHAALSPLRASFSC